MIRAASSLRSVFFWCFPTYAVVSLALASVHASVPFRFELALSDTLMVVMFFLPIGTLVAAVKAVAFPFRAADNRLHVGPPVVAWSLVVVALAMNVLCYMVIALALR